MVRRAGAGQACGPAPDTPRDRCPGQTVTLPVELAAVPATRTFRPGVSPALPFPHATEDGPVSTRPVGVGVGGKEHGASRYRGTARQLIRPAEV
jgi:hypothetical protein